MKIWTVSPLSVAILLAISVVQNGDALPVPESLDGETSFKETSLTENNDASPVLLEEDMLEGSESQQTKVVRSIVSDSGKYVTFRLTPSLETGTINGLITPSTSVIGLEDGTQPIQRITKALEEVSQQLGLGFRNLGNSAIQILEGVDVAAEQALGTGARIVTGIAETAAETAETGARKAIRIANGVANTLTQGTKTIVDTKTSLLKGLTGAASNTIQADASTTVSEAVQRNERGSGGFSGYPSSSYGPNTAAETPNNFINVFSQAAANTVNFGTQLLNSLIGVAANILQGTVSTLLSLLNAKGQIVGAVVQSAPPVLASVTRTTGDVLAAKARIFGAVTQSAVNFASQLAQTITNTFSALFNGPNALNLGALLGRANGDGNNVLGGVGNLAQTAISTKLNLLNSLLSPFTGGRPLLNFGGGGGSNPLAALFNLPQSSSGGSSGGYGGYSGSASEPNFRITIAASTQAPASSSSTSEDSAASSSTPNRATRYFQPINFLPAAASKTPSAGIRRPDSVAGESSNTGLLASLSGLLGGMLNQMAGSRTNKATERSSQDQTTATNTFLAQILPNNRSVKNLASAVAVPPQSDERTEAARKQLEQSIISQLLRSSFTPANKT